MNLVHRDLKPENVVQVQQNLFKICDMGLIKDLNGGRASTMNIGTPYY